MGIRGDCPSKLIVDRALPSLQTISKHHRNGQSSITKSLDNQLPTNGLPTQSNPI